MREQNWAVAAEQFQQSIKANKGNADAAMYWRAHALYQAGRKAEAERQISSLESKYPDSRWIKEAQVLQIENQSAESLANREAKMAALEAFSMADDIDMLKQVLANETDPELRRTAIHGLAMSDSEDSAAFLETLYFQAGSKQEKKDILESLIMMDYSETLALRIVRAEMDPDLQKEAIHVLGINGDQPSADYLIGAFPNASRQDKSAIIESLMIMDDAEGLIGLIKIESDPEMKRQMLEMLTAMDSEASDEYLFKLLEKK